ncbi:prephenate dehydratase [Streptomyces ochraceiscleroticus]|uniref:prephenate dehydratase n=1 Tax=Streptomyces ochraceiscleroticus TaxID=47761 RepID=A0ABW1MUE5_9ACTN|nr:prephenate dehydratase [Streptomyces ochraceiscleroticus]
MPTAYLGPSGSFTEAALAGLQVRPGEAVPYPGVRQALDAVRSGAADAAVVPWENSVEGAVTASVDALAHSGDLCITGETLLPVQFALAVPPGGSLSSVHRILTHPHAHAQCRTWIDTHLPHADFLTSSSTAQAARDVANPGNSRVDTAAIASPNTLRRYGLEVIAENIGARPDAVTRFVKVARPNKRLAPPTGADRSTMVVPLAGRVSDLHDVLHEFVRTSVPLTSVLSRPSGTGFGGYSFLLECEGHIDEPPVGSVVASLRRRNARTVFLGSYPRATPTLTPAPAPNSPLTNSLTGSLTPRGETL